MRLFAFVCAIRVLLPVESQQDFDRLQQRLDSALSQGASTVDVRFAPGVFQFREDHVMLSSKQDPGCSISFSGNGTYLVGGETGDGYTLDKGYVDLDSLMPVDIREPVRKAYCWPLKVLFRKGVYKIRCREPDRSPEEMKGCHIILSQWFKGAVYPVLKIRHGWLYFRKEKDYGTGMWSELRFGRCLPRYILCHPPVVDSLHACGTSRFLCVDDCRLERLSLQGISFLGNGAGRPLIDLEHVSAEEIVISDCVFAGIKSDCIHVSESENLTIENCLFRKNYLSAIVVEQGSRNSRIVDNRFLNNGLMMTNAPVVACRGVDYLITGNYFEDFSYAAIGLGIHYTLDDRYGTRGVVEKNEICMSEQFREGVIRSLIDGGAIYVGTSNQLAVVRNNDIHDIAGPHGNRGILADDGVINVEISGNRIFRIRDANCIDLRKHFKTGRHPKTRVHVPNVGNKVYDNVFDGRCIIYIRKDDAESFARNNRRIPAP